MIDFLKLNISYMSATDLLQKENIDWRHSIDISTAELTYPIWGQLRNFKMKINPTRIEVKGSMHQFYNLVRDGVKTNHDDFNLIKINHALQLLIAELPGIENGRIENLEFGLNINSDIDPTEIIENYVISFDNMRPARNENFKGSGKMIQFKRAAYNLKMYDKGRQVGINKNTLRIEVHYSRSEELRKFEIKTFSDLTSKEALNGLYSDFLKKVDKLILIDPITHQKLSKEELSLYKDAVNPRKYESFRGRSTRRQRFKQKVNALIYKYGLNVVANEINNKIKSKGDHLLNCYDLNDMSKCPMLRSEPYIYDQIITEKKCIVTGIGIENQKCSSRFLSELSIRELSSKNPTLYEIVKERFGPKQPVNLNRMAYYIAHNIRNGKSNFDRDIRCKIDKYRNSLFPLTQKEIDSLLRKKVKQLNSKSIIESTIVRAS